MAVASEQSIKGAARTNVFWNEYQLPKAALWIEAYTAKGLAPANAQKAPKATRDTRIAPVGMTTDSNLLRQLKRTLFAKKLLLASGSNNEAVLFSTISLSGSDVHRLERWEGGRKRYIWKRQRGCSCHRCSSILAPLQGASH